MRAFRGLLWEGLFGTLSLRLLTHSLLTCYALEVRCVTTGQNGASEDMVWRRHAANGASHATFGNGGA